LAANALTERPAAATGVCPSIHPFAVGILSVGMLPCGLAAGIVGELPQAGSCEPSVRRRVSSAAPPISETSRAKVSEKLNALFHSGVQGTRVPKPGSELATRR
jgi:hypothetical protein